ncbi:MAG: biopolymer transporter ExbD [Alphaproteobacteria bacterium]|jgi:biopolymer transport protein ExbD|nr:biopolymer transporter ExbD [Alphaproteobacteria bacterium]
MAGNIGTGESAGGKRGRYGDNAEINVTPFVDVMLVLLIIFMVSAPLATISIPLDLPPPNDTAPPDPIEPIFVSLQDTGVINVGTPNTGEIQADWTTLGTALQQKTNGDLTRKIFIRADQKVIYADVMRLMDAIDQDGYKNKALVAEDVVD